MICTFFNDLCFFQISALFSMICAFFRYLHFFQISALLSDFCTSLQLSVFIRAKKLPDLKIIRQPLNYFSIFRSLCLYLPQIT